MITDTLAEYGIGIEEASAIEENYQEYTATFTDNRLYRNAVREVEKRIFKDFCGDDIDVALGAYHDMQALKKVLSELQTIEADYHKVQAIIEVGSDQDY